MNLFFLIALILFAEILRRDFVFALALFFFLLPSYLIRFQFGFLPTTGLEILFVLLFFRWLFLHRGEYKETLQTIKSSAFFYPGALLVLASGVSVFFSADLLSALGIWKAYFLEPFLLYAVLITMLKTKNDWQKIFLGLGGLVCVVAVLAIYQYFTGNYLPTWEWAQPGMRRATAFFTSPNALALLVVPILLLFGYWQKSLRKKNSWMLAIIVSGLVALFVSHSRGGWGAFLAVVLFASWKFWSKKAALLLMGIGVLFTLVLPSTRMQVQSLFSFQVESGQSRLVLYEGTWELLTQSPRHFFFGLGLSNFAEAFEEVRPEEFTEILIYPHNIFLNFWAETGILGLIAVLWVGLILIRESAKEQEEWFWLFLLPLLAIATHGLIDVPYFKNDLSMLTWFFLSGAAVMKKNDEQRTFLV